jgi:cytochrome P450 family 4 subfamily V
MASLAYFVIVVAILTTFFWWLIKHLRLVRIIERLPGPCAYPLIGNALQYKTDPNDFFAQAGGLCMMFQKPRLHRIWLMLEPLVIIYGAEEAEVILGSNRHINKSHEYRFLQPWMGFGLLTSYADKWRPRRKLLTPTFHYDILKDFVDIFNQQSKVMVDKLQTHVGQGSFDVYPYVTLCALDIICESAMGKHVHAQQYQDSDYVKAIYKLNQIIHERQKMPLFWPDIMFQLFGQKKEHDWCLKIVHGFTNKVIEERYRALKNGDGSRTPSGNNRKRLAFLDLLIDMAEKNQLSFVDICDEVNTFMFEGHDTTAAGMNWALHLLGCNPEIQAKVHQELDSVFGDDSRDVDFDDLKNLPYLECCLKEALRLYPSVPMFARTLQENATISNHVIPGGTQVIIYPYLVHRDSKHWPDPEVFNPDRFLAENSNGRHPYAYLPFSAGARNCIGQRFALMEEKTLMAWILRYFKIKSVHRRDQIRPKGELILRPSEGVHLVLESRRQPNFNISSPFNQPTFSNSPMAA